MKITSLNVTNFRNMSSLRVDFSEDANILYGDNGSGKTNLLEAVLVLCLGRSQRGAADGVMLRHDEDVYRIEGEIMEESRSHTVSVAYQRGTRRRITIDSVVSKVAELYDRFCAVSAGPEDSEILSGSPSVRRLFMDIYTSQFSLDYLGCVTDYARTLSQRNAALRQESDTSPFDLLLVQYGSAVIVHRRGFISAVGDLAARYYGEISGGGRLNIRYQPSVGSDLDDADTAAVQASFRERLSETYRHDRATMVTLVGPHRDEVLFDISGCPARSYGSQGELRTAAISLKLAVYQLLKEHRGITPVLLLDEIFAELDATRSQALIEAFGDFGQLFLTTAAAPPQLLRQRGRSFKISRGTVQEVD